MVDFSIVFYGEIHIGITTTFQIYKGNVFDTFWAWII